MGHMEIIIEINEKCWTFGRVGSPEGESLLGCFGTHDCSQKEGKALKRVLY